jgi:hypothetical protein
VAIIGPDLTQCAHCKSFMAEGVAAPNARLEAVLTLTLVRVSGDTIAYGLCGLCALALGEFVEPSLKERPEWQSGVDQIRRAMDNRDEP